MLLYGAWVQPANRLDDVRRLAADENTCEFYAAVREELRGMGIDSNDLREIIISDLGPLHFRKAEPTLKKYPTTMSDYYSIWLDECGCNMFLKLLIADRGTDNERLVVTSFKRDEKYAP